MQPYLFFFTAICLLLGVISGLLDSCPYNELGTFSVGRQTASVVDPNQNYRTLVVNMWYPAIDQGEPLSKYRVSMLLLRDKFIALDNPAPILITEDKQLPLLVFLHGLFGMQTQSIGLMEHLASWGFIVAACDHAGNSSNDPPSSKNSIPA